jgi:D-sedoheptulose 7-phosphate isomerase
MTRRRQPIIRQFFGDLSQLLGRVEVTDRRGTELTVEAGIEQAIDLIRDRTKRGSTLMFIGNGGSASIASHQSLDFWRAGGIRSVAFNDPVLLTCISNDFGYPTVFERPIDMFAKGGDILCAISSSGCSENILRGACKARQKRCSVLTMSGFAADNPLRQLGDLNFYVPSDSYGHVEITHLSLSHCMVDTIKHLQPRRNGQPTAR